MFLLVQVPVLFFSTILCTTIVTTTHSHQQYPPLFKILEPQQPSGQSQSQDQHILQFIPGVSHPIPIIWSIPTQNFHKMKLPLPTTTTVQPPPLHPKRRRRRNRYLCDQIYQSDIKLVTPENKKEFQNCCYSFPKSTFSCNNPDSICWREPLENVPKCCDSGCGGIRPNSSVVLNSEDRLEVVPPQNINKCDHLPRDKEEDWEEVRKCCWSFPNFVFSCNHYRFCGGLDNWAVCCSSCGAAGAPIQKSTPRPGSLDLEYYDD